MGGTFAIGFEASDGTRKLDFGAIVLNSVIDVSLLAKSDKIAMVVDRRQDNIIENGLIMLIQSDRDDPSSGQSTARNRPER